MVDGRFHAAPQWSCHKPDAIGHDHKSVGEGFAGGPAPLPPLRAQADAPLFGRKAPHSTLQLQPRRDG
jgi:hypothetical protein